MQEILVIKLDYLVTDNTPHQGTSYYRLKQTDFNGDFVLLDIVSISLKTISTLAIFPNPSLDGRITVYGPVLNNIVIYNSFGQNVTSLTKQIIKGESEIEIELSELSSGVYYLKTGTDIMKFYKR